MVCAEDVTAAAERLRGRVVRTPCIRNELLDAIAGREVWLKAENLQRVGAFKARGAINALLALPPGAQRRGVITYSSGNHAQAVALAARDLGMPCHVTMPEDAPEVKVQAVRALGSAITFAGTTSRDRERAARELSEQTGAFIVPPFDDDHIIAGQGTATLELFEDVARASGGDPLDALLVPVGGGGLLAGACLVAGERGVAVHSVEPSGCDAMARSLEQGERVVVEPGPTIADGLKPVQVGERNFAIAKRAGVQSHRVEDDHIGAALVTLLLTAKLLVEPSGAAALAVALMRGLPPELRRVGVILSGGNIGRETLEKLLARHRPLAPPS